MGLAAPPPFPSGETPASIVVGAYVSRMGHIQVAYVFMLVLRQLQP
jgi:hypothetical protein